MNNPALTRSVEDYLKAIFALSRSGDPVATSAIAESLTVQPASVTGMVKRMAESGLLEHVPYKGVRLTEPGEREALRVIRRHRILETYLCDRLGFSWDDVHDEAERLEHAASDELVERMAKALGSPSHDPHGAPIPTVSGDIELEDLDTLAESEAGSRVVVRSVRDQSAPDLRSMAEEGLFPGARLFVDAVADDGSVSITVEGGPSGGRPVPHELARYVFVAPDGSDGS